MNITEEGFMAWRLQVTGEDAVYSVHLLNENEFTVHDGAGEEVGHGRVVIGEHNGVSWLSCELSDPDRDEVSLQLLDVCV